MSSSYTLFVMLSLLAAMVNAYNDRGILKVDNT